MHRAGAGAKSGCGTDSTLQTKSGWEICWGGTGREMQNQSKKAARVSCVNQRDRHLLESITIHKSLATH